MNDMEKFKIVEVSEITGLSRANLQALIERGFIWPSYPSEGQGKTAYFSRGDIYTIALFRHLTSKGFSRKFASLLIENFAVGGVVGKYLVVRPIEGEGNPDIMLAEPGNIQINPLTGMVWSVDEDGDRDEIGEYNSWTDIYIINCSKIFEKASLSIEKFLEAK